MDNPQDVDINNAGTFYSNSDDYMWVLNGQQIKRFTTNSVLHNTYGVFNCDPNGVGNFCRPTAVVCGRTPFAAEPFSNDRDIYVADDGNHRLVWLTKNPNTETITWNKSVSLPMDSHISDLEVDNFGQVWAVDEDNGRIYKYTYDLYPLCYYGSFGTGDGQFNYPLNFSNTGGYLGCGDAAVAESWTDNSGGQYFAIGTDIVDFEATSSVDYQFHYINYTLVDASDDTVRIYDQGGQLIKTLYGGLELSGPCTHVWNGTNQSGQQVNTGDYHVVVSDSSTYRNIETKSRVNGVVKEAWVHHEYPNNLAPDSLIAYQSGADKVTLNWQYPVNPTDWASFTIYCDGCLCGWCPSFSTSYTDSGLIPGKTYVYWVRGYYLNGVESTPSNADTVTITSMVLTPSVTSTFPLERNSPELPLEPKLPLDSADLEIIYQTGYPGHSVEIEVKLKSPLTICGFNFLIKPNYNQNLLYYHTNSISQDSILINSIWLHFPVREGLIDTAGSLISGWNSLLCRGQVGDTTSPYDCEYLWIKGWAPPNKCISPNPNYRKLLRFGVDAFCIPDSVTDRAVLFYLPFSRLYSSDGEEIPFRYHVGEFMTWYSVPGDANGDSLINVGDIMYMINYLFRHGPRSCIPETADGNGSCLPEVGDITTLINYLFRHGSTPLPGCWYGK